MKIISMSHTLVVLMVVLTFSTSFATLAQQNSALIDVSKTAAGQNANAVVLEAKAAAERDASKDTTEPLWFCLGGTLPFAFVYAVLGRDMILDPAGATGIFNETGARIVGFVFLAVSASCIVGTVRWSIFTEAAPPPDRLIGKSPEYVESYLNAYKRKVRRLRGISVVAGSGAVCLPILGLAAAD